MNKIYLHKDAIQSIIDFMERFPDTNTVMITSDDSSGIGPIVKAHLIGVNIYNTVVTVSKDIVDETSW